MTNMLPQAPDQNQGPWANMEQGLRDIAGTGKELYVVMGGHGTGGTGDNGLKETIAEGHVTVPNVTWKVVLVLAQGTDDVNRVTGTTRTIAVIMPNSNTSNGTNIRDDNWQDYIVSVDEVESLTGYDFFSNVADAVENGIEAGINGNNPPGTAGQSVTMNEDNSVNITLTAASPGGTLTYTIVSGPTHGQLTGSDGNRTYTPDLNYFGQDNFTFKVNDGTNDSNISTVSITVNPVNDVPVLTSSVAMSLISSTNSNLFNVGLEASATDQEGETVTIQVSVFGDEDDQTPTVNDVVHSPDAKDFAPNMLRLRGERIEANDGRVYLIIVTATDTSGGVTSNYHTVVVPKNNKQANIDAVNAQAVAAIAFASSNGGTRPPGYFVIGDGPIIGPKQ
jgi:hypothetical protein